MAVSILNLFLDLSFFVFVNGIANFIHQKDTQINPMKKLLIFILILISLNTAIAQEAEDVGWIARFGAAGGFTPTVVFPNVNPINTQILKNLHIENLSNNGMLVLGGSGYAYIMLIDNLRIGGMGLGGTQSSNGVVEGLNAEVKYSYGLGGFTAEYTLPFINKIAVSLGAIIGVGSSSVEVFENADNFEWTTAWSAFSPAISWIDRSKSRKFSNTFFTVTPTLNIDIPIDRFIALRVGGGYIFSTNNEWKVDNDKTLRSVPSDLKSNSFFIQTGIYFGLFAF